jgi:hypothetical protein
MAITRTPIIDDDGSGTTGTIINNAWKTELYNQIDALPSVAGVWTPYTTVWAGGDGIGPTPGNAILSGRYFRVGKWVDVAIVVSMGSTTSYGTSSYWVFSLPFQPALVVGAPEVSLRGFAVSSNGGVRQGLTASYITAAGLQAAYLLTGTGAFVNPTTPFTWSAGAVLSIRGSYEV